MQALHVGGRITASGNDAITCETAAESCVCCETDTTILVQALHVGDRFTASGNDAITRDCCCILWVANPEETDFFIKLLLADLRRLRMQPYIE